MICRESWSRCLVLVTFSCCVAFSAPAAEPQAKRPAWTASRISGTPQPPAPYRLVEAFPKVRFQRPTSIEQFPDAVFSDEERLLVTEMSGKIYALDQRTDVSEPHLIADLKALLPKGLAGKNVSLFDVELHPKFRENRHVFVCYVHPDKGNHTRVSRLTLSSDSPPKLVPNSEQVIITWPSGGHNGGCLEFGSDGMLYISTGDGSGPNPPDGLTTGQDVSDLLGAILRIDVNRATEQKPYVVPSDNPFVGHKDAQPEIWAYGLRNPWKFGVDPESNDVFAADNGWESWEMVHKIVRGGNCGWPVMEGRVALRTEVKPGPTPILPPVKDHSHSEANSVIGGPVYRGKKLPGLNGSFVYGDYITGTLWAIKPDKDGAYSHTTLVDTDQRIIAFTQGAKGELYVLDYDFTGAIYELLPSNEKDNSANFPRKLSQTGLFSSLDDLKPAPGVVPYDVIVSRWMDGAIGQRWIAIPGGATPDLLESKFPEGTVLVKQINLPQGDKRPALRLETQLLHFEAGTWRPYSYLWDERGHDATLVDSIGASRPVRDATGVERTWRVSAVNECKLCHNAESKHVLGFNIQPVHTKDPAKLVDPHDTTQTLDDRARSYLHANCGMCHQPGGNAIVSFFLRRDLPFEKLNTNKGTGIGTFGMRDAKIIVPGDPYRSILFYRMSKLGYARMPYIGSQVVDSRGIALIDEWIRSLPPTGDGKTSTPLTASSSEAKALQTLLGKEAGERESAARKLVESTEGSLALVAHMHRGSLSGDTFQTALDAGREAKKSEIRGLFDTFLPESQRRATLGTKIDLAALLKLEGDRNRGKLIFFSDNARCRTCHEIDDPKASLGPTLQEINKKYPQRSELLQHVVQPSQKIDEPFATHVAVLGDGQVLSGLMVESNGKEIVLKTAEKKLVRVPHDQIEELKRSPKSLMPDGILADLTAQEAADLLEYWQSLGSAK